MTEYIFWQDGDGLYKREKIVRCRDCKYSYLFDMSWSFPRKDDERYCSYGTYLQYRVPDDGFCAWGERNEKGTDND